MRWQRCRRNGELWLRAKCWNSGRREKSCIASRGGILREKKIDLLLGVRGLAEQMVEAAQQTGMRAEFVATPEEAGEWLARETRDGDVVLLKGSRGVKLEKALEKWQVASVVSRTLKRKSSQRLTRNDRSRNGG